MFFTRSIRRKLMSVLALVMLMMGMLAASGLVALTSFGSVLDDLDDSIHRTPRRANLSSAIARLFEPLSNPSVFPDPQAEFGERLSRARTELKSFRLKLDKTARPTPAADARRPVIEELLNDIDGRLAWLDGRRARVLAPGKWDGAGVAEMVNMIVALQVKTHQIPNVEESLERPLRQARSVYEDRLWLASVAGVVGVLLFVGLVHYGYVWLCAPIRQLHLGARRVALGEFNYRVHLNTNDEMSELAEAFNKMTIRFQEIAGDLDRQVRERSKQLVRSERLAGIGFLAAGVAHEINNPLSAVAMAAESIEGRLSVPFDQIEEGDAQVVRQYLAMIQREAFRCQQITERLLDFSRGQDAGKGQHNLTALITEVLDMIGHMGKFRDRAIQFERAAPCYLEVNGPEIKQVVLNLVANALESMESGGTLRIELREQTDRVDVTFIDDGCGMTPTVVENLFEPFFTQRKTGKGTGLGLSITHRIVSDHGGAIEATSDGPGTGSTFCVHLPRQAASRQSAA